MTNPKSYLYEWCTKNSLEPQFDIKEAGKIIYTLILFHLKLKLLLCNYIALDYIIEI